MAVFQERYETLPNGQSLFYSDTVPSSLGGAFVGRQGDYCIVLTNSTGANNAGLDCLWFCTASGSPGTWVSCARGAVVLTLGPFSATSTSAAFPLPAGNYKVSSVSMVASVVGGAGAVAGIEWLTGTTAPGSGTAQLTGTVLVGTGYTVNTVTAGTVIAAPNLMSGATDRLGVTLAGTLTGLANLYITVTLQKFN